MKKLLLFVILCTFTSILFANDGPKTKARSHSSKAYIMMQKGKLFEVSNGHKKLVRKDITLINESTIHPNGSIDVSSGENVQLKEGEYITMDGRIRKLKVRHHHKS